jgi:hypothetical protein
MKKLMVGLAAVGSVAVAATAAYRMWRRHDEDEAEMPLVDDPRFAMPVGDEV